MSDNHDDNSKGKNEREPFFGPGVIPFLYWSAITALCWWGVDTWVRPVVTNLVRMVIPGATF